MEQPPPPPEMNIVLDDAIFNKFNNDLKTMTLETMKSILRELYKDPKKFSENEEIVIFNLKKQKMI
jgi:hypothetical protein